MVGLTIVNVRLPTRYGPVWNDQLRSQRISQLGEHIATCFDSELANDTEQDGCGEQSASTRGFYIVVHGDVREDLEYLTKYLHPHVTVVSWKRFMRKHHHRRCHRDRRHMHILVAAEPTPILTRSTWADQRPGTAVCTQLFV